MAGEDAHHRRGRNLLRRLRCAGDRLGAAGDRPALEARAATDRLAGRGRFRRAIGRRVVLRLHRGALRSVDRDGLVDRALRGDEPRLRAGLGLQLAADIPRHPGHRARRRGAGRGDVHQRALACARPRALRPALRAGVSGWSHGGGAAGNLDRAPLRLAMDVRDRRAAGAACTRAAQAAAGIPALACGAWPSGRSRGRHDPDRGGNAEGDRQTIAGAPPGRRHARQERLLVGSVRSPLPAADARGVGDLVRGLFRQLRPAGLAANDLSDRVPASARRLVALRADHANCRPGRHARLRFRDRPCRAPPVVRAFVRRRRAFAACADAVSEPIGGADVDLRHHRQPVHQHDQYRRLSLHARALPDAGACDRRRHGDGMAALCLDDRPTDRGHDHWDAAHACPDPRCAHSVPGLRRGRSGGSGRDRTVCAGDQGTLARGGFAVITRGNGSHAPI